MRRQIRKFHGQLNFPIDDGRMEAYHIQLGRQWIPRCRQILEDKMIRVSPNEMFDIRWSGNEWILSEYPPIEAYENDPEAWGELVEMKYGPDHDHIYIELVPC